MSDPIHCPACGIVVREHSNPFPTTDVIIYHPEKGIVLVERANPPHGWAIPGGFVETGEDFATAAIREMEEETGLEVKLLGILGVYSQPQRDPRFHTITVTFVGEAVDADKIAAGDDAAKALFFPLQKLPQALCFDHDLAVEHFRQYLNGSRFLLPFDEDMPQK